MSYQIAAASVGSCPAPAAPYVNLAEGIPALHKQQAEIEGLSQEIVNLLQSLGFLYAYDVMPLGNVPVGPATATAQPTAIASLTEYTERSRPTVQFLHSLRNCLAYQAGK